MNWFSQGLQGLEQGVGNALHGVANVGQEIGQYFHPNQGLQAPQMGAQFGNMQQFQPMQHAQSNVYGPPAPANQQMQVSHSPNYSYNDIGTPQDAYGINAMQNTGGAAGPGYNPQNMPGAQYPNPGYTQMQGISPFDQDTQVPGNYLQGQQRQGMNFFR